MRVIVQGEQRIFQNNDYITCQGGHTYEMLLGEQLIIVTAAVLAGLLPALIASGAQLGLRVIMLQGFVVCIGLEAIVVGLKVATRQNFVEILREE